MSKAESLSPATSKASESSGRLATLVQWWLQTIEPQLDRLSEWLNPILVKEARQALKSRQFTVTFTLLLVCAWGWSFISIFSRLPDIYYMASGMSVLIGYYTILAVPLLLVVPFTSFRSLASEREDGTYELLSISTLTSRQIVLGKLNSALLQMMVYYSALAPCIAFTYMLRGVDIVFIALLLFYTFVISVLLSCVGLVFAGASRTKHWQSLLSVVLLLGLVLFTFFWALAVAEAQWNGLDDMPYDQWEFWAAQGGLLTAAGTYIALLIEVAAAQNSFESDNRSTRIRAVLTLQTVLFFGWVAYGYLVTAQTEVIMVAMMFAGLHWLVYAAFLTGENPQLSPRVRRRLPNSFAGRVLLTWYNPGSGSGYLFSVSHLLLIGIAFAGALIVQRELGVPVPRFARPAAYHDRYVEFICLSIAYFAIYIGIGRLIFMKIPHRERHGLLLPVLVHLLVTLAAAAVPYFVESWTHRFTFFNYSLRQSTNWAWTLSECIDKGIGNVSLYVIVGSLALFVFLLNLLEIRTEVQVVRAETPDRVLADDGLLPVAVDVPQIADPLAE